VLDEAAQAQFARRGAPGRLLVGETLDGLAQERPVLGQGLDQVGTLTAFVASLLVMTTSSPTKHAIL
jgi:hypothetical protein